MIKVLITRPRAQSSDFGSALQQAGFEPVYFPVIEICPMEDLSAFDEALANLGRYDWLVLSSVNAVGIMFERLNLLAEQAGDGEATKARFAAPIFSEGNVRVAAVGKKTAEALRTHGIEPDFVPGEYVGEEIIPGLGDIDGKWVLLPRAEIARKELPKAIAEAGGVAHEISVYRTLPSQIDLNGLEALKAGVGWITFTSPSTVQNFVQITRQYDLDPLRLPGNPNIACLGPITEKAAREEGFGVDVVPGEYTTEGLIHAILQSGKANQEIPCLKSPNKAC